MKSETRKSQFKSWLLSVFAGFIVNLIFAWFDYQKNHESVTLRIIFLTSLFFSYASLKYLGAPFFGKRKLLILSVLSGLLVFLFGLLLGGPLLVYIPYSFIIPVFLPGIVSFLAFIFNITPELKTNHIEGTENSQQSH